MTRRVCNAMSVVLLLLLGNAELNIDNTCTTISNAMIIFSTSKQHTFSFAANTLFASRLVLSSGVYEALEFICAQAPLRLKGLLIGVWYAFLAINYLLIVIRTLHYC